MLLLSWMPTRPLEIAVGLTALVFSLSRVRFCRGTIEKTSEIGFKSWEPAIGFLSGIVYGASNVAVTVVAYLKSREISQQKFTATLATTILILSIYRTLLANFTGLYAETERFLLSIVLTVPALIAVKTGAKISLSMPQKKVQ